MPHRPLWVGFQSSWEFSTQCVAHIAPSVWGCPAPFGWIYRWGEIRLCWRNCVGNHPSPRFPYPIVYSHQILNYSLPTNKHICNCRVIANIAFLAEKNERDCVNILHDPIDVDSVCTMRLYIFSCSCEPMRQYKTLSNFRVMKFVIPTK